MLYIYSYQLWPLPGEISVLYGMIHGVVWYGII